GSLDSLRRWEKWGDGWRTRDSTSFTLPHSWNGYIASWFRTWAGSSLRPCMGEVQPHTAAAPHPVRWPSAGSTVVGDDPAPERYAGETVVLGTHGSDAAKELLAHRIHPLHVGIILVGTPDHP